MLLHRNPPLLERLPLNYDDTTLRTIEQIDVLWLKGRSIRRAFEVEHVFCLTMSKTAIICDRVSSDEQAAIGRSIEDRNAQMLTYATANGMTVIDTLVDDITGKILIGDRPKGKRILEYIDTRRCDSVIWFDVDRVGRDEDALSLSALRRRCRDAGVELHFAKTGKCDLESMSAVLDYFKALAAADERRKIIERTHGGRKVKARRGQLVGCGTVGYGFRKVGSGKTVTVEIDQDEAHVIRRARDLILGRGGLIPMSVQAVCALFDSERIDIPIKARRKKPEIKFDYWHGESLSGILRNPAITGHFIYSDIEIDKPELAIISPEDQAALDVRIRANKLNSKGARRKDYLMAKRLTCVCGRHYSGATFNLRGYALC